MGCTESKTKNQELKVAEQPEKEEPQREPQIDFENLSAEEKVKFQIKAQLERILQLKNSSDFFGDLSFNPAHHRSSWGNIAQDYIEDTYLKQSGENFQAQMNLPHLPAEYHADSLDRMAQRAPSDEQKSLLGLKIQQQLIDRWNELQNVQSSNQIEW